MKRFLTLRRCAAWSAAALLLLTAAVGVDAQGRGPFGGGGGTGNPGPYGVGVAAAQLPPVSYEGKLEEITDQLIVVKLDNGRMFNFRRSGSTRFYKNSQEVKADELKPGDRVSVEAKLGERAFLFATKVTFELLTPEKAAELAARASQDRQTADAADPEPSVDGGGPVLRRRVSDAPVRQPKVAAGQTAADDALIEKAQEAALSFSDALPNFRCEERMQRLSRDSGISGWTPLDTISAEVIYEDGEESYRNLKINDRLTDRKMEQLSGSWSTGEFATTLRNLFHPDTAATFRYVEASQLRDLPARVYDFAVTQENSHWNIQIDSQKITPAYQGTVWIEPESGRVLRMEMQASDLPADFPMDQVESAVDYAFVPIGTDSVLLPVHAENLACQRGSNYCSRNVIDFRDYRRYVADSKVRFDP